MFEGLLPSTLFPGSVKFDVAMNAVPAGITIEAGSGGAGGVFGRQVPDRSCCADALLLASLFRHVPHLLLNEKGHLVNKVTFDLRGGELGIRTPDTLVGYTHLAGERLRPLGQLSMCDLK